MGRSGLFGEWEGVFHCSYLEPVLLVVAVVAGVWALCARGSGAESDEVGEARPDVRELLAHPVQAGADDPGEVETDGHEGGGGDGEAVLGGCGCICVGLGESAVDGACVSVGGVHNDAACCFHGLGLTTYLPTCTRACWGARP